MASRPTPRVRPDDVGAASAPSPAASTGNHTVQSTSWTFTERARKAACRRHPAVSAIATTWSNRAGPRANRTPRPPRLAHPCRTRHRDLRICSTSPAPHSAVGRQGFMDLEHTANLPAQRLAPSRRQRGMIMVLWGPLKLSRPPGWGCLRAFPCSAACSVCRCRVGRWIGLCADFPARACLGRPLG
jgi:hypothetical protein